ncbi:MAG: Maf family protein [Dermabacter sp.]|nr:Maf family protein [Dermabacter sp.]
MTIDDSSAPEAPLLLLASASPGRRDTLRRAHIAFTALPADVDEEGILAAARAEHGSLAAADEVLLLARAKAERTCSLSDGGYVVLGADSMLEVNGELVGKPLTPEVAVQRWKDLRSQTAVLHTGHWLIDDRDPADGGTGASIGRTASARLTAAALSDTEIEAYVATGEPLWVAGGFTIDGYGGPFIERIEGDHHTVIGLSLPLLREMLAEVGLSVTDLWDVDGATEPGATLR